MAGIIFSSHSTAIHTGAIPNRDNINIITSGIHVIMLTNARITAPLLVRPIFSMRAGAFRHITERHRLTIVASTETLCAFAPTAITDGD